MMNLSDDKIAEIKTAADIVEVISESVVLKKNGKDHFGLCPFHSEKSPSFSVAQDKQMFYCFGCGAGGDVIEYLVKKDGLSFPDAAIRLADRYGVSVEQGPGAGCRGSGSRGQVPGVRGQEKEKDRFIPEAASTPAELWQEKAGRLVAWAHDQLMENTGKLAWLEKRGIIIDTVHEFKLGWNPGENGKDIFRPRKSWKLDPAFRDDGKEKRLWVPIGLIVPYIVHRTSNIEKPGTRNQEPETVLRIRIRRDTGDPKYYVLPGSGMGCMVLAEKQCRAYVIVESELDALLVFQEVRQNGIGVVALGSAQKKPDMDTFERICSVPVVLNSLDYDKAGAEAVKWWKDHVKANVRWPVPVGKDPGDAVEKHGLDIGAWIKSGLPEAWSWKGRTSYIEDRTSTDQKQQTVGRSSSCLQKEGGASPENELPEDGPLMEFVRLVKRSPVAVHVGPEGIKIVEAKGWSAKDWSASARLSELVMFNPEVRERILALAPVVINRNNVDMLSIGGT